MSFVRWLFYCSLILQNKTFFFFKNLTHCFLTVYVVNAKVTHSYFTFEWLFWIDSLISARTSIVSYCVRVCVSAFLRNFDVAILNGTSKEAHNLARDGIDMNKCLAGKRWMESGKADIYYSNQITITETSVIL